MEVASAGIGQGSEFVTRLPIVQRPATKKPESTVSEPSSAPTRRILVVDDNLDSAQSLSLLLSICGYETHAVYDGLAAVESAANFRPDVVLLDIGLPQLNGYEVARRIRGQEWGKEMVLIALTGWGQREDRQRSKEAGFDHHLTKPVDPDALRALLAGLSVS